jgi:putative ABC transport system permease protein
MLKNQKWFFYVRHLFLMSTINKVRLLLTSVGIFVAVFLFSSGMIITNSYYNGSLETINEMQEHTLVLTSSDEPEVVKNNIFNFSTVPSADVLLLTERKSILSTGISEDQYLTVMAHIQGVTSLRSFVPVVNEDGLLLPCDIKLVRGRLISQSDLQEQNSVVVIDELTEALLFPQGNSVGEHIELDVGGGGVIEASEDDEEPVQLEVIGVIKNTHFADISKLALKKDIAKNDDYIFVNTSIYIPLSTLSGMYEDINKERFYVYAFDNRHEYETFSNKLHAFSELKSNMDRSYNISTKEVLLSKLKEDLTYTRTLLDAITILLCIISGISIMSITFFSVKERIPEIGIRKAFGASKLDIVFQFIFETVIIAFFVSIFAVLVSFYACKLAEGYLASQLFMSFTVYASAAQLILPLFVGVLEAVICSIVPSLYAAKIKVTDSLRFE